MDLQAEINAFKAELDNVSDPQLLAFIKMLLRAAPPAEDLEAQQAAYLRQRVLKAEKEIAAGQGMSVDEAKEQLRKRFGS